MARAPRLRSVAAAAASLAASFAVLAAAPTVAAAQPTPTFTYGKADELKDVDAVEWGATAEAGLVVTTGNSRTTTISAGAKATRKEKKNKFSGEASATYARSSNQIVSPGADNVLSADEVNRQSVTSAEAFNLKLRYDRFLTECDSLYVAALAGADVIAGKDIVGGGQFGYARRLFKSDRHEVSGEVGYDFSYEGLSDGSSNSIHSGRLFVGYKGKLGEESSLDSSVEALLNGNRQSADVGPLEDTRATAIIALSTKITKGIALSVSFTARLDADPAPFNPPDGVMLDATNPPETAMIDTTTKASLIITLL
jgi:hypothetical protein